MSFIQSIKLDNKRTLPKVMNQSKHQQTIMEIYKRLFCRTICSSEDVSTFLSNIA